MSCLRFVPLTFYENQSANLVSGSKRAEEKIFWRWTWLCSAAAKNGFLCPMSKCLGVCRGFCFKPQSCHSKKEMTNKKRESGERENEVINQIQQTDVSENGWCVFYYIFLQVLTGWLRTRAQSGVLWLVDHIKSSHVTSALHYIPPSCLHNSERQWKLWAAGLFFHNRFNICNKD